MSVCFQVNIFIHDIFGHLHLDVVFVCIHLAIGQWAIECSVCDRVARVNFAWFTLMPYDALAIN